MSIKRQDERHSGDTVKELKDLFDKEEPEQAEQDGDQQRAPRMRIVGDMREDKRR